MFINQIIPRIIQKLGLEIVLFKERGSKLTFYPNSNQKDKTNFIFYDLQHCKYKTKLNG